MTDTAAQVSRVIARRFILGKQGLWPGRRWSGSEGVASAMTAMQHLQLDPLQVVARSQDLALLGRVTGYTQEGWQQLAYGQRRFFDWGGWLAVRPMGELPYWRRLMRRTGEAEPIRSWAQTHRELLDEMRRELRDRGPLSNRDFDMDRRQRVNSYRGRKDSAVALYHLWRTGEAMIHDRQRFERVYDLSDRIAPAELLSERDDRDTERFLFRKSVAAKGLARSRRSKAFLPVLAEAAGTEALAEELLETGTLATVAVEGWRDPLLILSEDLPLLEAVASGQAPQTWQPLADAAASETVTFLSPLEPVISDRQAAMRLFDFDYVWEVYKPAERRRWGYYVLPVLWGDLLVARVDMKLERKSGSLSVLGCWFEDTATIKAEGFAAALAAGFADLIGMVGATRLEAGGVAPVALRRELLRQLKQRM